MVNYAKVNKDTGKVLGVYLDVKMEAGMEEQIVKLLQDDEEYIEIPNTLNIDGFRKTHKYNYSTSRFNLI